MTFLARPMSYARDELRAMIHSVEMGSWIPAFPTLHNTSVPSLKQYLGYGPTAQAQFAVHQESYERGLGWHSGVHFFCCPAYVWNVCDLKADGVSVSCWNHQTIGIEMVGDYEVGADDFNAGPGAAVRDNAIWTLACLCEKFGWRPDALRFHRECAADRHACPGSKVDKAAVVASLEAQLTALSRLPAPRAVLPTLPPAVKLSDERRAAPGILSVEDIQAALGRLGESCAVDGEYGPATKAAVARFQARAGLLADGWVGPQTAAALKNALAA